MKTEELSKKVTHCSKCGITLTVKIKANNKIVCHKCYRERYNIWRRDQRKKLNKEFLSKNKICSKCGELKTYGEFKKDATYKDGISNTCHTCRNHASKNKPEKWIEKRVWNANNGGRNNSPRTQETRVNKLTVKGMFVILEKQKYKCKYCGILLTNDNLCLEHRIPITRGGKNLDDNIDGTCLDCNRLKFKMTDVEFETFIITYIRRTNAHQLEIEDEKLKLPPDAEHTN